MPLTKEEREFLDAYVFEAMHEPFGGPATTDSAGAGSIMRTCTAFWSRIIAS